MSLPDDVLLNKAAIIERCVMRAREEYADDKVSFAKSLRRQDAAILNAQRAYRAAMDMGQHLLRHEQLGTAPNSLDTFRLLARAGYITDILATSIQQASHLLHIAIHDCQAPQLQTVERIIVQHLDEFLIYSKALLKAENVNH